MMKQALLLASFLTAVPAFAGRSNHASVFVRDVDCLIQESDPPQYFGTAEVTLRSSGRRVRMRFLTTMNRDMHLVCRELENAEGTTVRAIYNFDETPEENLPRRVIHGFTHFSHAHIVNGSTFADIE